MLEQVTSAKDKLLAVLKRMRTLIAVRSIFVAILNAMKDSTKVEAAMKLKEHLDTKSRAGIPKVLWAKLKAVAKTGEKEAPKVAVKPEPKS